jgi:hypothetical protein
MICSRSLAIAAAEGAFGLLGIKKSKNFLMQGSQIV